MPKGRFEAIDVLRGICVIGMICVITPGSWEYRFAWLNHADWQGFVAVDMIFPTFLFCCGFSLPFSFSRRIEQGHSHSQLLRHVVSRSVILIVVGLLTNAFPFFDWPNVRIPGVLQRIALCWALAGMIVLFANTDRDDKRFAPDIRMLFFASLAILAAYWAVLQWLPVPGFGAPRYDSLGSWPAYIDRMVFGPKHLWFLGKTGDQVTFDPEGILSTFPATVNVLAGTILGTVFFRAQKTIAARQLALIGIALVVAGLGLNMFCPAIKKIWTSSFALFSIGVSILLFAVLHAAVGRTRLNGFLSVFRPFGTNALLAFVIAISTLNVLDIAWIPSASGAMSARNAAFDLLAAVFYRTNFTSFLFTVIYCMVLGWLLLQMQRRGWHWKA